jgi:signal peptidase I
MAQPAPEQKLITTRLNQLNQRLKKTKELILVSPLAIIRVLLKNYFYAIVISAAVALIFRAYIMEAFYIPTDFMAPTLLPGDHVFSYKLAYIKNKKPLRGDLILFRFVQDPTKEYVKRVIGIEGDVVEIRGAKVFINQKPISSLVSKKEGTYILEEVLEKTSYQVFWEAQSLEDIKMSPAQVPPKHLFVLGDNRTKGQDSRGWGYLPIEAVRGQIWFIWFSRGEPERKQLKDLQDANPTEYNVEATRYNIRWHRMFSKVL